MTASPKPVTPDDIRRVAAASTPHFSQQVKERIEQLIADLPAGHPAREAGEAEIEKLGGIARSGEVRGTPNEPTLETLRSVSKES